MKRVKSLWACLVSATMLWQGGVLSAEDPAAEKLWREVVEGAKPPVPPEEWQTKRPTQEEQEAYRKALGVKAAAAADKAREFYTKFPESPNVAEAKEKEQYLVQQAVRLGQTQLADRLEKEPEPTEDQKVQAEVNALNARAMARKAEGLEAVLQEFEKGANELLKQYPKRGDLWQLVLLIAQNSPDKRAKELYDKIIAGEGPEEIKKVAQGSLKKLDAVGQPFEIAFTAVDGREIDSKKLKGKVLLIDFWATWCGPCIQELPNVLKAYNALNKEGFEILGISLDKSKPNLEHFLAEQKMTWPQYFDGKGWGNKFVIENNIMAVPTMWLVDKKGILRDLQAREGLESKVKELLAEK